MKKTTLIKTGVFAIAAIGFCVLGSKAQERAGFASLRNRTSYAQRTQAAQKASVTRQQAAPVQQTGFSQSCGTTGCGESVGVARLGCGTAMPAAPQAAGCGCSAAVPFPTGCSAAMNSPFRSGGSCGTASCGTGSCGTSACGTSRGGLLGNAGWGASRGGGLFGNVGNRGSANACGYGSGYNQRMSRLLGGCGGNACGGGSGGCGGGSAGGSFWTRSSASYQRRNARLSQHLFGWMIPSGNGGMGSPPFGKYHTTYAQNANHFDQRDGSVYGAQGYGTHITTPLAPNVRHAYNYGWGMPSSRITHVSNVAPYTTLRPLHW